MQCKESQLSNYQKRSDKEGGRLEWTLCYGATTENISMNPWLIAQRQRNRQGLGDTVYTHTHTLSPLLGCVCQKGPRSNDHGTNEHILCPDCGFFNSIFQGFLGEMADSWANAGKVQGEPGTLCSTRKSSAQKTMGICPKHSEVNLRSQIWNH